jgi:Sec-independent protein translocase protein TatA
MGDVAKGIKSFKKGMASDVTDDNEPKKTFPKKIKTQIKKIKLHAYYWLV